MKFPQGLTVWADPLRTIAIDPNAGIVKVLRDDLLGTWNTAVADIKFEDETLTFTRNGDEKWELVASRDNSRMCLKGIIGDSVDIFIPSYHPAHVQVLDRVQFRTTQGDILHIVITRVNDTEMRLEYHLGGARRYVDSVEICGSKVILGDAVVGADTLGLSDDRANMLTRETSGRFFRRLFCSRSAPFEACT